MKRPMKPSGLGWAGDIPAHWDVAKLCLLARLESGHTPSRQRPDYWIPEECTIPWLSLADVWQLRDGRVDYLGETSERISPRGLANSPARLLPAGTVVLSRTASVGFAGIMPAPMATTQDFANWIPGDRVLSEYLLYALRSMRDDFRRVTMGSTHQTIYMPDIRRLAMPVPPPEEQARIVGFLRARLPAIDELIAKKERLALLLQEKRQAVITQAVTKGLDPNVKMKESGIEWLPVVPETWDTVPLRHLLAFGPKNGISPPPADTDGTLSFSISAVRDGRVNITGHEKYVALEPSAASTYMLRSGDILLMRGNGNLSLVGTCGLVDEIPEGCTYPDILMRMRPNDAAMAEYLVLSLNAPYVRAQIELFARTSNGTYKVSGSDVRSLMIAVPSVKEQQSLLRTVRRETTSLDRAVDRMRLSITKLREYRQSLITAAVTGKLDVSAHERVIDDTLTALEASG